MNGGIRMLTVNHLNKSFGKVQAVKNVSFNVRKSSTFAFLGTNGSGKSTVIHMMIDLLKPDTGVISIRDNVLLGVVFQSHRLDEELSIETNLMIRAKLYGMSTTNAKRNIKKLLELTNLFSIRHRLYGKCSGGEKRKTDIIRALIHQPDMLILDEPTTGLDAESRKEVWTLLQQLQREQGLTIFLTTHYIEEAAHVDYVVMMHEGEIKVEGTPDELRNRYAKTTLILDVNNSEEVKQVLQDQVYEINENKVYISIESNKEAIPILRKVEKNIINFSIKEANLERVFLQITDQIKNEVI